MQKLEIQSSAPLRIEAGGLTDVPELLQIDNFEGHVLNAAINPHALVTITSRPDTKIVIHSGDFNISETFESLEQVDSQSNLALIKAAILYEKPRAGFNLSVETGIYPGSGLGASAAVAVATLSALKAFKDQKTTKQPSLETLAKEAIILERDYLRNTGGTQDQFAATFGGINFFTYSSISMQRELLNIPQETKQRLIDQAILVYSGGSRVSGRILDAIIEEFNKGNPLIIEGLIKISETATALKQSLISGDLDLFGSQLSLISKTQSSLNKEIMTQEIAEIIKIARSLGALGVKIMGAGSGGCILVLCQPNKKKLMTTQLQEKFKLIDFSFSENGVQTYIK
ncbi:MAG: hypothetical protein V1868_01825 [Patescibacteria group bacterium]